MNSTDSTNAAISIENVHRSYGATKALDGVTFSVPKRSIFGLLGPNGAGKTTLFSIIANFLHPSAGTVRVLGVDVSNINQLIGRLSILPQDAQFEQNVPILEQLTFFRRLEGKSRREAALEVREALDKVGLGEYAERGVQVLSHGMGKRLGVAQAFLGEPEVILLDEPTAGLDPHNALHVRELIQELAQRQCTVVVSSHNLLEIEEICDHVAILDKGKLVTAGSVEEITSTASYVHIQVARELTPPELEWLTQLEGISEVEQKSSGDLSVVLSSAERSEEIMTHLQRALLDKGLTPQSMSRGNRLEDLFMRVTKSPKAE